MFLAQTAATAWWFLPFAVVIGIWVAWNDMARMKIPNRAVLALLAVYVVIGPLALPLDAYAWRYLHVIVVLVIGFLGNLSGAFGAGDAKFAAAIAPFVAAHDALTFLYIFAAALLAGFIAHRSVRNIAAVRRAIPNWESWTRKDFPMGLSLGTSLILYLVACAFLGA